MTKGDSFSFPEGDLEDKSVKVTKGGVDRILRVSLGWLN